MVERTIRSVRLGYKYFWDISQRDKGSWKNFYQQDYKFHRPDSKKYGGGYKKRAGIRSVKGTAKNTFNLQPDPPFGAQIAEDEEKALEYQRKRLFSWSLFHHGDETAAMFATGWGEGRIPTEESTTTDGGGRGGPREISREEGLKKFFWGMLRPEKNRPQITKNRGNTNTGFYKMSAEDAGSAFTADRIASDDTDSLLSKYQRDILPKAIWQMKKLTEKRINALLQLMPGVTGIGQGAQQTLGTMSEEELGILVMERIGPLDASTTEEEAREAVREAVRTYPRGQKRMEPGPQMVDIDPKYQPEATAYLTKFLEEKAAGKIGGNFLADLEAHKKGGYEVSMVANRLQAYYRIKKSNFTSTQSMINKIATEMQDDIRRHLAPGYSTSEGPKNQGVGHGMARRYHQGTHSHIYTTQMGSSGIAIYMVNITNGEPTVIPYLWEGPTDTLLNEMVVSLAGAELKDTVISELKAAQISDLKHDQMGSLVVKSLVSNSLEQINWLGRDPGPGGTAFGGKPRGGLNVRTQVSTVTMDKLSKDIFNWVNRGAQEFGEMIDIIENSALHHFLAENQEMAEKVARQSEHMAAGGWKNWTEKLRGKYSPTPQEAPEWTQFLHPRPYLTQDTRGIKQAEGALEKRVGAQTWNSFGK